MPQKTRKGRVKRPPQITSPKTVTQQATTRSFSKLTKAFQVLLACAKIGSVLIWVMGREGPLAEKLITFIQHILEERKR